MWKSGGPDPRVNCSRSVIAHPIDEYIQWWNTEQISTKLKGLGPVQYRAQALEPLGSH